MKILKSFGKALYDLRISKNVSLEKISQITKINQDYFEEFEKGNFSINNEVYIRLFLREYIKCIDISKIDDIAFKKNSLASSNFSCCKKIVPKLNVASKFFELWFNIFDYFITSDIINC